MPRVRRGHGRFARPHVAAALGPLALGILWRRDNFSLREKWLLTAAVAAYTALAVWLVYAFVVMMSARVAEIMNGMPV